MNCKLDELAKLNYEFVEFDNWNCKFDKLDESSKISKQSLISCKSSMSWVSSTVSSTSWII